MLEGLDGRFKEFSDHVRSRYSVQPGRVDDVSCVAGKEEALRLLVAPMAILKLLEVEDARKRLDEPAAVTGNCGYAEGEGDANHGRCLEVLAWEQEKKEKSEFADEIAVVDLKMRIAMGQLEGYQLYEVVDVTPREYAGTLAVCETRMRMGDELPADADITEDMRARWRKIAGDINAFGLSGRIATYQVARDVDSGRSLVRVTQGFN
jgi:hypothetical protein